MAKKKNTFRYGRISINKILAWLGIIIMSCSVVLFVWWEKTGRKQYLYNDIIIASTNIESGTVLSQDMLKTIRISAKQFIDGAINDLDEIIGEKAAQFIPKSSQFSSTYFVDESIELKEDEYILSIPNDWIITSPDSLRGGDIIYFYPVKQPEEPEDVETTEGKTVIFYEKKAESVKKEDVLECKVAYLKDSSNREVITISEKERFDASSNIESLEIIVKFEDIKVLQNFADGNYKFIILYKNNQ